LAEHLGEGGVLLVEPFLSFTEYRAGHIDPVFVDEPSPKIARMSVSRQVGRIALIDFTISSRRVHAGSSDYSNVTKSAYSMRTITGSPSKARGCASKSRPTRGSASSAGFTLERSPDANVGTFA
jgi:hypothetical protein